MPLEINGNPTAVTLGELWRNIHTDTGGVSTADITEIDNLMHSFEYGLFRATAGWYGDGSDGVLNFISTGSTTVAGATLSSGTYTMTRDIFAAGSTIIASGVTIVTAGFRFFCQGQLVNNGTISSNGNAAAANVAGALLAYTGTISNTTVGTAGGAGGTGVGAAGTNGGANGLGGAGGVGGASATPNAGGVGGTVTAQLATVEKIHSIDLAVKVRVLGTTAYALATGGSGGGAGGGDGTNNSGAGGGGGGIVMVAAKSITGTGSITANGGAGGNANATGNSAGGAGGGGGAVILISQSVQPISIGNLTVPAVISPGQTVTANGGAGGTGTGTGAAGGAGVAGSLILIPG